MGWVSICHDGFKSCQWEVVLACVIIGRRCSRGAGKRDKPYDSSERTQYLNRTMQRAKSQYSSTA